MTENIDVLAERLRNLQTEVADGRSEFRTFVEGEHKPLVKKVDGFVNFQKLLTMLWTGIVLVGGYLAGAAGWLKQH